MVEEALAEARAAEPDGRFEAAAGDVTDATAVAHLVPGPDAGTGPRGPDGSSGRTGAS